jgi:D-alanyl-D-alanine carboxypeptidase/D-alanyl-D-alanine-endopeptidase (penicillin-binding protein 4)
MEFSKKNIKIILGIITFGIILFTASQNLTAVAGFLSGILKILAPVIVGFCLAFILNIVMNFFEKKGINCNCVNLADGCGLSRIDQLTPKFIGDVYRLMYNSKYKEDYVATFPRAGKDGTMKNFCKGTRLEGKLALKTGSMSGVQCYGGYKLNDDGEPTHSVVIMINNFFCERFALRKEVENFLLRIF